MTSFGASLVEIVAPQLSPLGYEYDARLRAANELFGFRKPLGDDVQAIIQFQRRHNTTESFTVNLLRVKSGVIHPYLHDGYADACGARLGYVLWYVAGWREYPVSDYWWAVNEAALRDAAEQVARYGVPWLEDPQAPKPWEMPTHQGYEFVEAVEVNLARDMQRRGYRLEQQQLAGEVPYLYFVKELPDGTHGFVELQWVYSLDPHEFQFDVRLQRRADENPLALSAQPSASLAQLVWQTHGRVLETATVAEAKTLLWRYADRVELAAQLRAALTQIERIGLPWIDQAIV
jgi:hypothetical protein